MCKGRKIFILCFDVALLILATYFALTEESNIHMFLDISIAGWCLADLPADIKRFQEAE